jgi:TPR repeat protein
MKRWAVVLAGLAMAAPAFGDGLDDRVDAALKKPTPQEVVAALEREVGFGNILAAYQLGLRYRDGKDVAKDPEKALEYFETAGRRWVARYRYKLGVPDAQYAAGLMYLQGEGTPADPEAAAKWLRLAAEQGHGRAQLRLAQIYVTDSAPVDKGQAFFWAILAQGYFDLSKEEKETAASVQEQAGGAIGATEADRLKERAQNWFPRRML